MKRFWLMVCLCALAGVAHATSYTSARPAANYESAPTPVAPAPIPMTGPEVFAQQIGSEQLRGMLKGAVEKTPTYRAILAKHGKLPVETRLNYEIKKVAAQNQEEWNDNLAQSYEGLLEPKDWVQIVNKTPGAAVKRKFPKAMMTAGQRMQLRSQPLLQDMSTSLLRRLAAVFPL